MRKNFKIGISMLLAISLLFTSFAILASDDDNFFEGFEGGTIPPGWTVLGSGATKTWEITDIDSHSGSHSIICHYDNIYITQDEWLITPAINLSKYDNPYLIFWHRATWVENDNLPNYILISTNKTQDNKNDFNKTVKKFAPHTLPSNWKRVFCDLSDYKNDTVYIAWRYQSTHGEIWYIDDVYVGEYFDDIPPTISNVTVTPTIQKIDEYVNISWEAEDNESGLKDVLLNITFPNSSVYEIKMTHGSHYYHNTTYSLNGTYHFYIKAVDKFNNTAQTSPFSFIIKRGFNVTVYPSTTIGEGSNFTVRVKDEKSDEPVENATVKFGDEGENTTDSNGKVSFTAPDVTNDTNYTILVSKQGYLNCSINITVKNIDSLAPQIK
ncbi:MAG: choice-of-anchor J domain-containing protein, partial [Thermoplasmata archaeon]|nr:choice-of-anchor J domain-containing protein [Thermoplasmata archaeon]